MTVNTYSLSEGAFNAHMLSGVMTDTPQPGETADAAETRCAAIVEVFQTFDAANPMETLIACHCISLRYMLAAAMRDAGAVDMEPLLRMRMRASAMAIGKNLHFWLGKFDSLHARNEARPLVAQQRDGEPQMAAAPAMPDPVAVQPPPVQQDQRRPKPVQPPRPSIPLVPPANSPETSGAAALLLPVVAVILMRLWFRHRG